MFECIGVVNGLFLKGNNNCACLHYGEQVVNCLYLKGNHNGNLYHFLNLLVVNGICLKGNHNAVLDRRFLKPIV